jgi:hypothetical protein
MSLLPTVGRMVHYYPKRGFLGYPAEADAPLVAFIAAVWSEVLINIGGFDSHGVPFATQSVRLLRPGEQRPLGGHFCAWPPHATVVKLVPPAERNELDWDVTP